jgi:hypothetical protein
MIHKKSLPKRTLKGIFLFYYKFLNKWGGNQKYDKKTLALFQNHGLSGNSTYSIDFTHKFF